jgi:hypothetical protein
MFSVEVLHCTCHCSDLDADETEFVECCRLLSVTIWAYNKYSP